MYLDTLLWTSDNYHHRLGFRVGGGGKRGSGQSSKMYLDAPHLPRKRHQAAGVSAGSPLHPFSMQKVLRTPYKSNLRRRKRRACHMQPGQQDTMQGVPFSASGAVQVRDDPLLSLPLLPYIQSSALAIQYSSVLLHFQPQSKSSVQVREIQCTSECSPERNL